MNNRRRNGGNWLLHLAGIVGGYLLGRGAGKYNMMRPHSGDLWKRSATSNESVSTPKSDH
ncbi:MAG: hypothetical protein ACYDEJ_00790 [Desulfitobacteriaceae bacterium]